MRSEPTSKVARGHFEAVLSYFCCFEGERGQIATSLSSTKVFLDPEVEEWDEVRIAPRGHLRSF